MGVPSDEGSPFMPGSRFGPPGIREHSMRFGGRGRGYYDPGLRREFLQHELANGRIVDVGDADVLPTNVAGTFDNVTAMVRRLLDRGALPVVLGGDHGITYPVVRAYREPAPRRPLRRPPRLPPFVHGFALTNSHPFRHIARMSHVRSLSQIGIRSLRNSQVMMDDSLGDGNRIVTMEEFRDVTPRGLVDRIPRDAACYVSVDVDVLDMPLVPGCVSAEPNGVLYAELRDSLRALAEHTRIVGFDLVEVNPMLDIGTGITSYLAAHTIVEFLGWLSAQPWWIARRGPREAARAAAGT